MHKILKQWFPQLAVWLEQVPDHRKFAKYSMASMLMQGIFMFICQGASRNAMNNKARFSEHWSKNFGRLFPGMSWAHFDSVDEVLRTLRLEELEKVKTQMIRAMVASKRIDTFYGYYLIAVDGTGVTSYDEDPEGVLLHYESVNGKKVYRNLMLEAKLVTFDGLSLSIASEPLSNDQERQYDKQDCELKAFKRLTDKLHKAFPRLKICLLLDGLYANHPVMEICERYGWKYIVTLKDKSLGNVQEAVVDTPGSARYEVTQPVVIGQQRGKKQYGEAKYQWIEGLDHKGHRVNWLECRWPEAMASKEHKRFVYLTNLQMVDKIPKGLMVSQIAKAARLRWKIENEGFNIQKNRGYHLHHKYSRYSIATLHVYYILLQIAHIINQLVIHSREVSTLLKHHRKLTIRYLWDKMASILEIMVLSDAWLDANSQRSQIRLE